MPGASAEFRAATQKYRSFDGGVSATTSCFAPDRYRFWDDLQRPPAISRGAGFSYSPASFSTSTPTVEHRHFNRLLDFDSAANMLEVEAGVTLGQIYQFAAPRSLFLPVQPGHPRITVGGCIAADVHGKNQFRDGTFAATVESLRLFHPSHGILQLSPSIEPEVFSLTCGGYGLTGNIISARLRLAQASSSRVVLKTVPLANIYDLGTQLARAAEENELVYSWHDFTARGKGFGRGAIVAGSFDRTGSQSPSANGEDECRLDSSSESHLDSATVGQLPFSLFNRPSTRLFNHFYRAWCYSRPQQKFISLYEFLFPVRNKEIYFHLFGKCGFHECQILIEAQSFNSLVEKIQQRLRTHPVAITLASTKLFRGKRELLRFTGDGICLALNFPRNREGADFAVFLDELMIEHGGWSNLIKDSRLSASVVAATYPGYEEFRARLRSFDSRRLYRSELSERLEL
jgi:decaprenylphospho-beta-D-ribofuranose 2-oxidase